MTLELRIRKCEPRDGPFLAKSILMAGRAHLSRGIWEVILGIPEDRCLRFLEEVSVTDVKHLFQYSCYFIAETPEDIPVGSLGGYDPEKRGYQALQKTLPGVFRKSGLPEQVFREANERAARILACLPAEIDDAWVIDSVATMEQYRGSGVAVRLLDTVLAEGRNRGYAKAQIVMYKGNEPALQLYKKMGFSVIEETRNAYFEETVGSPGMLSLCRTL